MKKYGFTFPVIIFCDLPITSKIDYGYVAIATFTCYIRSCTTKKQVSIGC